MKKIFNIISLLIIFSFFNINIVLSIPDMVIVEVNGNILKTDTPAVIRNNRTMVPFRALFEALGASNIQWDEPTQTVIANDGLNTIKMVIGSYDIEVNGVIITMDTPTMIINSRTMIPLSFVSTNLGATVKWDAKNYIASVTKKTLNSENETSISNEKTNNQNISNNIENPIFSQTIQNNDISNIIGYYALEDLKRNKYVIYFDTDSKVNLINIKDKNKYQGTYSYTNYILILNCHNFNSSYISELINYDNKKIIFMKDNIDLKSQSSFAMMKITKQEYEKYVENK